MKDSLLEQVRRAVIAAVPEIMRLESGCRVKVKGSRTEWVISSHRQGGFWVDNARYGTWVRAGLVKEILGRPITLADLLRAIEKANDGKTIRGVFDDGRIFHTVPKSDTNAVYLEIDVRWNLALDLDDNIKENPALGEFLVKILCV